MWENVVVFDYYSMPSSEECVAISEGFFLTTEPLHKIKHNIKHNTQINISKVVQNTKCFDSKIRLNLK